MALTLVPQSARFMSLTIGTRLGSYEVLSRLGAGGMGEVFCARDSTLGREVAIKVLPDAFAADPDRTARFEREARVLASLNHSNIAAIYGLEHAEAVTFLVLELVPGETLADRLAHGALPIDQVLPIAKQIVDALDAAHSSGVVHRDLKPANIKVTPDDRVKVLDFGLAKAMERSHGTEPPSHAQSMSPTITTPAMTGVGVILGTAAYMAPEQARGKNVDKRADIWAFGCVLYELLTGVRSFTADEVSDTLAFVLTKDPDWTRLPASTPQSIRSLLRRCLEKDRTKRLADIADARLDIEDALTGAGSEPASESPQRVEASHRLLPWSVAAVAGVVATTVLILWAPWRGAPESMSQRLAVGIGADASLMTDPGTAAVISPDGSLLAFVAQPASGPRMLYLRRLDQLQATPLTGTEDALGPFFSPDNRWLAFFAGDKLKKVPVNGGTAITLADALNARGGTWSEDGTIVFAPDTAPGATLLRVSDAGGRVAPVTTMVGGEVTHRWPHVLPGGRALLYTAHNDARGYDEATIAIQPLPSGTPRVILRGGSHGRYLPSGHIAYVRNGTLFAVRFDVNRLEVVGDPVAVVEGISAVPRSGGAQFSVSDTGTMVYVSERAGEGLPMHWVDRDGNTSVMRATAAEWNSPQFSPDGSMLALDITDARGQDDIWIYDVIRDRMSRRTFDASNDRAAVWTPDGRRITYSSGRQGDFGLYWRRADGVGETQRLTQSKVSQTAGAWHPSGKVLIFTETSLGTRGDLMLLPMEGDETAGWKPGTPTVFLNGPASETQASFSPDGRWVAYTVNESGQTDVWVRSFPGPGGAWQVTSDGGTEPAWSLTRKELFYRLGPRLMAASYQIDAESFRVEGTREVARIRNMLRASAFSLHPDGNRVVAAAVSAAPQNTVVFVSNFLDELRRSVR